MIMDKRKSVIREPMVQDGIFFILFAVALFTYAIQSYQNDFTKDWSMSPYLFPLVASVLLVCLGAVLLLQGVMAYKKAEAEPKEKGNLGGVLIVVVMVGLYIFLLPILSFIPASILLLAAFMFFMGERRWYVIGGVSAGVIVVLYVIFSILLNVQLP